MGARTTRYGVRYNDGHTSLSAVRLARLRGIAACRSCGARPHDCVTGDVRILHAPDCGGHVDRQDAGPHPAECAGGAE